ncbi:MAG: efflux RND transporter periplasmic adaptor subunit [Castellaniella sp.]|uniref:efflux RND transporter periplasmic adaptor subunit n=1 Tax=Castellaniella sp. TaxID=1955812 RepID=UPI003C720D7B
MKALPFDGKRALLAALALALLGLFLYVVLRSGPLARIAVTTAQVQAASIHPVRFGIGTVEARQIHRIGPILTGRLLRLDVEVGDSVRVGQVLGEMDPVDLDDRIRAQTAALARARVLEQDVRIRLDRAGVQLRRYEILLKASAISEETTSGKRHELKLAQASLQAATQDVERLQAELAALRTQRRSQALVSPVDGVVLTRDADPGTTLMAGQAVAQVVAPGALWIDARFDQAGSAGLSAGLAARIVLRSRGQEPIAGRIARIEPVADAITEELLAKVTFDTPPAPQPALGELAETTVELPASPPGPVIPNAAIHRQDGRPGVWRIHDGRPVFAPIRAGATDALGMVQVLDGLSAGDLVIVHSAGPLTARSRIRAANPARPEPPA